MKKAGKGMMRVGIAAGLALTGLVWASAQALAVESQASAQQDTRATATASGEVRRVDVPAGKVALKHDAIAALELPAMTLVYQATPAMLANIKPGDRVRFTAAREHGMYVLIEISK